MRSLLLLPIYIATAIGGVFVLPGCAIRVPVVIEAMPITRVPGAPARSVIANPRANGTNTPPLPAVAPVPPPVSAPVAAAIPDRSSRAFTQIHYIPGGQSLPLLAKKLQIEDMAFRTLSDDPADQLSEARKNEDLVEQCAVGRPAIDFIDEVEVSVRHSDETDARAIAIGSYTRGTRTGMCGFHLTTTDVDMKDYAEDYVFVFKVTGTPPPTQVSISGFYVVQDYEGI